LLNPFKLNDLVWWKINSKTPEERENRKLIAKFKGPYKITEVIKPDGHGLNVEITHLNNIEEKHIVSIRQLKKAKLRPEQIGDLPIELENKKDIKKETPIQNDLKVKQTLEEKPKEIQNLKGRNIYTQARRAGKAKKIKDTRDEWEVESITGERKNPSTGIKEYKVKWVGYKNCTWQSEQDLENASEILQEWNSKKKRELKKD